MKIIQPTTEIQTITLILREVDESYTDSDLSMSVYEDGTGKEETISDISVRDIGNFDEVSFSSSILRKDFMYVFEITALNSLLFRGKMYCTDSFDGGVYDKNSEYYKQYPNNDNNYTVL